MNNKTIFPAWRFRYPGLDVAEANAGLRFNHRGGIEMTDGPDSIRQAILLLISTRPGERVMRPDYGCSLHRLLFSPNDDTTAGLAIHYLQQAIDRWEPRIEIIRLDANRDPQTAERLNILLEYRIKITQQIDLLTFSMDLTGDQPGGAT